MTAYHHYDLMCDHPGCTARFRGYPSATATRGEAALQGWRSWVSSRPFGPAKSGDSCPHHAFDLPEGAMLTALITPPIKYGAS